MPRRLTTADLGEWCAVNSVGVIDGVGVKVNGTQLHDGGLQGVPPSSPGVPDDTIVRHRAVVATRVVPTVEMGRVAPGDQRNRRRHFCGWIIDPSDLSCRNPLISIFLLGVSGFFRCCVHMFLQKLLGRRSTPGRSRCSRSLIPLHHPRALLS